MNKAIICYTVFFLSLIGNFVGAQEQKNSISEEEKTIYKAYLEKVGMMLGARGMSNDEINAVMEEYKSNNISSDADFAKVLGKLYPTDRNIALVFYYFNNDSLRISLFEPNKIIEQQKKYVKKEQLFAISQHISESLNLLNQSYNRTPQLRGVTLKKSVKNSSKVSFEKSVSAASEMLLPKSFTKKYKHLIVVPALNISAIPFHLLQPYGDKDFLIDHCSYSIAPSLIDIIVLRYKLLKKHLNATQFNFIQALFSGKSEKNSDEVEKNKILHNLDSAKYLLKNALFVSNPTYPTNTNYIFPNLPGAKKEIDNAIKYAKTYQLFDGSHATRDTILQSIYKADIAYFATHGIANNDNPMEKSFLVLSGNNGFLTAKDIMDTRLQKKPFPEMVILSACQTGLGKFMDAGTVGLARAFLIAGSNHVIMSLWNVDDEATAYLMNQFIGYLQNKNNYLPSGALRLAILDTKEKFTTPAKWASFTMLGVDF